MIRQAVSLRRTGHEYLAVQFENLFKLRTPWIESRKTLKVSARGPLALFCHRALKSAIAASRVAE
jgi:hypothetical protein